jgi:hypothetical protein
VNGERRTANHERRTANGERRTANVMPLRNMLREAWAERRESFLMIWANEKGKRTVEVTDPDLCGAGIVIEEPFFGDFGCGIGRGDNLNADLWSALEKAKLRDILVAFGASQAASVGDFSSPRIEIS